MVINLYISSYKPNLIGIMWPGKILGVWRFSIDISQMEAGMRNNWTSKVKDALIRQNGCSLTVWMEVIQ